MACVYGVGLIGTIRCSGKYPGPSATPTPRLPPERRLRKRLPARPRRPRPEPREGVQESPPGPGHHGGGFTRARAVTAFGEPAEEQADLIKRDDWPCHQ